MIKITPHRMHKLILFFFAILVTFSSLPLLAEAPQGIALDNPPEYRSSNPATKAVNKISGVTWRQSFSSDESSQGADVLLDMNIFSYDFLDIGQASFTQKASVGVPLSRGFYMGTSLAWQDSWINWDDPNAWQWDIGFLNRTLGGALSWGVVGEDLNDIQKWSFGIAIRPFAFFRESSDVLTLYSDFKIQQEHWLDASYLGASYKPYPGVEVYGSYDFFNNNYSIGLTLSPDYAQVGTQGTWKQEGTPVTTVYAGIYNKHVQKSLPGSRYILTYNKAQVITDIPENQSFFNTNTTKMSLLNFISDMEKISKNDKIATVVFRNQDFKTSLANLQEIQKSLLSLKKAGKTIYFFNDSYNFRQYALAASVADKIYLSPAGRIDLLGETSFHPYVNNLLSFLGVKVYNFKSHPSKSVYNTFSETEMSDAERAEYTRITKQFNDTLISMIETGRSSHLKEPLLNTMQENVILNETTAIELGYIDASFRDAQWNRFLQKQNKIITDESYLEKTISNSWVDSSALNHDIVILYANGSIIDGQGLAGKQIASDDFINALHSIRNRPNTKALVIRVNSGGGSALASDRIAYEIKALKEQGIPVIVSMGGVAASGGYYISSFADKIFADPLSITGSIGVVSLAFSVEELLGNLKIKTEEITTTPNASLYSAGSDMNDEQEKFIRSQIAHSYDQFISVVSDGRRISKEKVNEAAQGQVWLGEDALNLGLIDELGGLRDAIQEAKKMSNLHSHSPNIVEIIPGKNPWTRLLMQENPLELPGLKSLQEQYKFYTQWGAYESLYLEPIGFMYGRN